MLVTAAEFSNDTSRYLKLVNTEDIFITENGKAVAKLTVPRKSSVDAISGILKGKVPDDIDRHSIREERLKRYESDD